MCNVTGPNQRHLMAEAWQSAFPRRVRDHVQWNGEDSAFAEPRWGENNVTVDIRAHSYLIESSVEKCKQLQSMLSQSDAQRPGWDVHMLPCEMVHDDAVMRQLIFQEAGTEGTGFGRSRTSIRLDSAILLDPQIARRMDPIPLLRVCLSV